MFRRVPGPVGYTGDRLGLWEYQSQNAATEKLQAHESGDSYAGPVAAASVEFQQISPNNARHLDLKKRPAEAEG